MGDELLRDGRYRVVEKLGEGAQGTTFDAIDNKTGAAVAIKRFSVRGARSWKDVELAEREAKVLESLSHPALPAHVDHFEENGALYLVMQKIEGESLAKLTGRGGALAREDVVRFLRDASSVLEYLHGRSPPVIHRDINPKNVIRRPDGSFALVDFGAVRDKLKPEGGSTVVGTFGFMAPEQLQGRALPATDVYSVGATALRLLTGREPETLPHRGLGIDVNAALGSGGDPALREILGKMLDPDPDRRASSIAPLLKRLDPPKRAEARNARENRDGRETRDSRDDRRRGRERPFDGNFWHGEFDEWRRSGYDWEDGAARVVREARHWAREERDRAREDARRWQKEGRRRHEERRAAHRAWKRQQRAQRRGGMIPWLPRLLMVLGLNLAIFVVGLVLGVVVPTVLLVLSVLFGRPLRNAAHATRLAGEHARQSMNLALRYVLHGPPAPPAGTDTQGTPDADSEPPAPEARVRAATDETDRPRVRVAGDVDVVDTTGTEEPDTTSRRREAR